MRSLRYIVILGAITLIGCEQIPQKMEPAAFNQNETIGIVSILGNKFKCQKAGLTIFNNENVSQTIKALQVNQVIEQSTAAKFSAMTSSSHKPIQIEEQKLVPIYTPDAIVHSSDYRIVKPYIDQILQDNQLDYLILYIRLNYPDFVLETNQRLDTLGCVARLESNPLYMFFASHMLLFKKDHDTPIGTMFMANYRDLGVSGKEIEKIYSDDEIIKKTQEFIADTVDRQLDAFLGKIDRRELNMPF